MCSPLTAPADGKPFSLKQAVLLEGSRSVALGGYAGGGLPLGSNACQGVGATCAALFLACGAGDHASISRRNNYQPMNCLPEGGGRGPRRAAQDRRGQGRRPRIGQCGQCGRRGCCPTRWRSSSLSRLTTRRLRCSLVRRRRSRRPRSTSPCLRFHSSFPGLRSMFRLQVTV